MCWTGPGKLDGCSVYNSLKTLLWQLKRIKEYINYQESIYHKRQCYGCLQLGWFFQLGEIESLINSQCTKHLSSYKRISKIHLSYIMNNKFPNEHTCIDNETLDITAVINELAPYINVAEDIKSYKGKQ